MKKIIGITIAVLLMTAPIFGTVYTDPTNDLDAAVNNDNLNFTGAEVTNNPANISFEIKLVGDIQTTDWGKYMIGIDSVVGGDTNGNAWARPISMSSGMDYWFGGWVDATPDNIQLWKYDNDVWTNIAVYTSTINPNSVVYSVPLSSLGLSPSDSFTFDIYSSGGGGSDTAIDALSLSTPTVTGWSEAYDSGANVSTYQVLIPEPVAICYLSFIIFYLIKRK